MVWKKGEEFKVREEAIAQRQKEAILKREQRQREAVSKMDVLLKKQEEQLKEQKLAGMEREISRLEHPIRTKIIAREKRGLKLIGQKVKKKAPVYFGKLAKGAWLATKWGVQEWRRASEKARERRAMEGPRERVPMFPRKEPRPLPERYRKPFHDYERKTPVFKRGPPSKGIFSYLPTMKEIEQIKSRKRVDKRTGKSFRTRGGLTVQTRAGKLPKIKGLWDLF